MKSFVSRAALAAVIGVGDLAVSSASAQITIPTVPVGNPGNAADPTTGFGSVAYTYNIGTTEVTNAQYAAFLNAVARTDSFDLYNLPGMAGSFGGIVRSGSPGSYAYSTVSGRANHPVNFVSFWDACRFANWLHNGQPTGPQNNSTTEDGAYTLTPGGISANTITRNAGWQWAVTSENEWYKAAYFQPASAGGDSDNYWLYPTSSNAVPTSAQGNFNFTNGIITPVGSYAANYFGTFDMGGNVEEWNEAIISGLDRVLRGGAFNLSNINLRASFRDFNDPWYEASFIGFRVSQAITLPPNLLPAAASGPIGDVVAIDPTASVPFSYTVQNAGAGPVQPASSWVDAAYLSADTIIDAGDLRVPIARTGPVNAGGTYTASGVFTGVAPGTYNLIVRVNDTGALNEGGQTSDNTLLATSPVRVVPSTIPLNGRDFASKYGEPLWVQTLGTGFADNTLTSPIDANGSEINAAYARISNGMLFVAFSGNLENNGNNAVLAVDFAPGGSNTLQLNVSDPLLTSRMSGLRFDDVFRPEVVVAYSPSAGQHTIAGALNGTNIGAWSSAGRSSTAPISTTLPAGTVHATVDNSNVAGVGPLGSLFVGPPALVNTGIEFAIPLTQLGWDGTSPVRIGAFINGQSNDYLSNQVLGGLPANRGNLGGDGTGGYIGSLAEINFNTIPAGQFVNLNVPGLAISTVPIDNPGNPLDEDTGLGSVAYAYEIGTYEVTNAQYAEFLNAKAQSDPFDLYSTAMSGPFSFSGGIIRSGVPGSYTYALVPGRQNNPVSYVSFWDACRFANWLHNGKGDGDTETGAYTLTPAGIANNTVTRNPGWRWAVTSEAEWYKAAYFQPASAGGDFDNYWLFPTSSNTFPTPSQGNFFESQLESVAPVGTYAPNASGTFDMAGNVWEWTEEIAFGSPFSRVLRGDSYAGSLSGGNSRADSREVWDPQDQRDLYGFRVVRAVAAPPLGCDDIDFNNNGVFPEDQDVFDFFDVLAGGSPATCDAVQGCNDIDFNNNGVFPEDQDVFDLFNVLAGGACP